jgi:hypothetical protein
MFSFIHLLILYIKKFIDIGHVIQLNTITEINSSHYITILLDILHFYTLLAVPGHALLWLIPVQRKRTKREVAHVSHTFNVPMPVGNQYFCGSIFCADI